MRHIIAFLVKLVATIAAMYFVALFFPLWGTMSFWHALVLGLIVAVIGYASDLIIARSVNYFAAFYVDIAVAALVTRFGNSFLWGMNVTWTFALFVGLFVGLVEIFYHFKFIEKRERSR